MGKVIKNMYAEYSEPNWMPIESAVGSCFDQLMQNLSRCVKESEGQFKMATEGLELPTDAEVKAKMGEMMKKQRQFLKRERQERQ